MVDKEKAVNEMESEKENEDNDTKQCVNRIVIKPKVTTNIDISGINVSRQIS